MAIYHLSIKTVSRSSGRSATGAAAYRAAVRIVDERDGMVHDYRRKRGVLHAELVLPDGAPEWATDRATLWNAVEQAERRKNSTVAREFEVALPAELDPAAQRELAIAFAKEIVARHGCVADVAIHAPGRGGDNRNVHAHILLSTRRLEPSGFTEKTRELDDKKTGPQLVTEWRARWAELTNAALAAAGTSARVDHRSLAEQGVLDRAPMRHLGPAAVGYERRTGQPSRRRRWIEEQEALERLARAKAEGEAERQAAQAAQPESIIDVTMDVAAAAAEAAKAKKQAALDATRRRIELEDRLVAATVERDRARRALQEGLKEHPLLAGAYRRLGLAIGPIAELEEAVLAARRKVRALTKQVEAARAEEQEARQAIEPVAPSLQTSSAPAPAPPPPRPAVPEGAPAPGGGAGTAPRIQLSEDMRRALESLDPLPTRLSDDLDFELRDEPEPRGRDRGMGM